MIDCKIAFSGSTFTASLQVFPCCAIDSSKVWRYAESKNPTIEEKLNNPENQYIRQTLLNGSYPVACSTCEIAANNNLGSMQTAWNGKLENSSINYNYKIDVSDLREMTVTIDSICNSRCMTCGPGASTSWSQEIYEMDQTNTLREIIHDNPDEIMVFGKEYVEEFIEKCTGVEFLTIYGGEPTVSSNYLYFLNRLVDTGRSKSINLSTTTNLTNISAEILSLWKEFKSVHVTLSIDGVGKVNEYIRYPFKWEKVDRNLRKIFNSIANGENISAGLSCTVSNLNVLYAGEVIEYWCNLAVEYDIQTPGVNFNRVHLPSYSRIELLGDNFRQKAIERIDQSISRVSQTMANASGQDSAHIIDKLKLIKLWCAEPQVVEPTHIRDLYRLIETTDRIRERNIVDYIPETYDEVVNVYKENVIEVQSIDE